MPHIVDLGQNKVWEGSEGDRWIVAESLTSPDEINVKFKRLKVEEQLIPE